MGPAEFISRRFFLSRRTECVVEDALGSEDHCTEEDARVAQRHERPFWECYVRYQRNVT